MLAETQSPATIEALLRAGVRLLAGSSASPRLDAEVLLAHVLACSRSALFMERGAAVEPVIAAQYLSLIHARQAKRPVAQLTGRREFWSMDLRVTADVLTPRPETELLVERALARLENVASARVLDLGTGSGAIALALASERPDDEVIATDISLAALDIARANAQALKVKNIRFTPGDWFAAAPADRFDVIVSNPPYIADAEWPQTDPELAFEPREALSGGRDGLDALRIIVAGAPERLRSGGWLIVEHGATQAEGVRELFRLAGFAGIATFHDLAGLSRVTEGRTL